MECVCGVCVECVDMCVDVCVDLCVCVLQLVAASLHVMHVNVPKPWLHALLLNLHTERLHWIHTLSCGSTELQTQHCLLSEEGSISFFFC